MARNLSNPSIPGNLCSCKKASKVPSPRKSAWGRLPNLPTKNITSIQQTVYETADANLFTVFAWPVVQLFARQLFADPAHLL